MKKQPIIIILLFVIAFVLLDNFYFHIVKNIKEATVINSLAQEVVAEVENDIKWKICDECGEYGFALNNIYSIESGGLYTWTECYVEVWSWVICKKCGNRDLIVEKLDITANAEEMIGLEKILIKDGQAKEFEETIEKLSKTLLEISEERNN